MATMATNMVSKLTANMVSSKGLFTMGLTRHLTTAAKSAPQAIDEVAEAEKAARYAKQAAKLAAAHEGNLESISFLPIRLRNFFAKYPPQFYSAAVAPASRLNPPSDASADNNSTPLSESEKDPLDFDKLPSPYTPSREAKGSKRDPTAWSASKAILHNDPEYPNPFLPQPTQTKRWRSPKYSLRTQADLVKMAKKYGVEQLLPTSRKSTIFKETRLAERGLAIKGTGIGQKVKGHKWERTMETRLEDRKKAMMEMPELIRQWKQRGHGRGWKKWPRR